GVIDGQLQPPPIGLVDQPLRLVGVHRHRLLDQHVLAGAQRLHRQLEVRRHRGGDDHRVDPRVVQQIAEVAGRADGPVARPDAGQVLLSQVANRDDLAIGGLVEVADEIRSPVAVSDDANTNHSSRPFLQARLAAPLNSVEVVPMTAAGTPATIACAGTSFVTTAPAPTSAPSPMVTPARIVALLPIEAWRQTRVRTRVQSASVCRLPSPLTARG